jgi:hypothetical protein
MTLTATTDARTGSLRGSAARILALGALAIALWLVPSVRADEFIDRVNALYSDIRPDRRSDPIVLGALASMQPPPAGIGAPREAALLPAGAGAWAEAEAWAKGETQVAMLTALDAAVANMDDARPNAFGQPYGLSELGSSSEQIALIQAGLYTDLGDPPLLSAARHLYLPRFDEIATLVHVEATRRLATGDAAGALDVLLDWVWFARQIADREFHAEKIWAADAMLLGLERIRDVVYNDFRTDRTLTTEQLKAVIGRLRDIRGPIATSRVQIPRADFIGTEQLIATVMTPRGRVKEAIFAPTMARLASTKRPLRLFGEAARWDGVAQAHVDWFAASEALAALRNDYEFRWPRDHMDPLLSQPYVIERYLASPVFRDAVAVVTRSLPDMRDMFAKRLLLRVELVGTRNALGLVGFFAENKAYPLDLSAIRPRFVTELEGDPFAAPRAGDQRPPLNFFVPQRDTKGRFSEQQTTPPHEINILAPDAPNVAISLRSDQFVLYSVGADGSKQWADEAQNTAEAPPGRDYLLWPPLMSVVRDALAQAGRFD